VCLAVEVPYICLFSFFFNVIIFVIGRKMGLFQSFLLQAIQFVVMYERDSEVRAILEYFHCMIDNTAEAWSCCSSRSGGNMLQVWFSCSLFVPNEHSIKMTAPLEVCTKDKQHAIVHFLVSEGMNWLPSMACLPQ
jgi:hypothetical protein